MGFLNRILRKTLIGTLDLVYSRRGSMAEGFERGFNAAKSTRFEQGWITQPTSGAHDVWRSLRVLRARSRELCQNDDYAKRFLGMLNANVIGPKGITLQNRSRMQDGELDETANDKIESSWKRWSKVGKCDVTGTLSWIDLQNLFLKSMARDGEILVRKVRGFPLNEFGFALQFIEADHLDENMNEVLPSGNVITMGVEKDRWKRPVAYHLRTTFPGEATFFSGSRFDRVERVPADEIIHAGITERVNQTRFVPWMHSAMTRVKYLNGYEEAEVVAARTGACKMGFFTRTGGEGGAQYMGSGKDSDGNLITEAEPAIFEQLPDGMDIKPFNPDHPNAQFDVFMRRVLQGIASGLNVSYSALSSDLSGVNFSSIRAGLLDERESWRSLQRFVIEHFIDPIFEEWLLFAILSGALDLPAQRFNKFNQPTWRPRGWAWVDPLKDANASEKQIQNGLKSRTDIAAEQGIDFHDTLVQLSEEQKQAEELGVPLVTADSQSDSGTPEGSEVPDENDLTPEEIEAVLAGRGR